MRRMKPPRSPRGPGNGPGAGPRDPSTKPPRRPGRPAGEFGARAAASSAAGRPARAHDRAHDRAHAGPRPSTPRPVAPKPVRTPRPATAAPTVERAPRPTLHALPVAAEAPPPPVMNQRGRVPDAPRGTTWLYGTHAVAAALANPARRLRRLLMTTEAQAAMAERLAPPWPIGPEMVERGKLDTLLGRDAVHQGVALLADVLASAALATVLERPGPVLILDQVTDPRNVGAILRCAAAFRACCVIVQERNAPEETGALAKAASGALETMPLLRAVNLARTLIALKAAGCWTIGLDAGARPLSGVALAQRRVAIVVGAEGEGLRRLTRETCDELAGIAMPGGSAALDSLNVAAATAVALYELGRR